MRVRKAVFPAAGWGTRFLPATKAQPKEMLPLVDKPIIQYAVEEAVAAGIEQVIIVTSSQKRAIEDHFDLSYELEHLLEEKGDIEMLRQVRHISDLAQVAYVRQKEQLGLGHAVLMAKDLIGHEPFAVILPDDVVVGDRPCIGQLIHAYHQTHGSVVAVMEVPPEETSRYGDHRLASRPRTRSTTAGCTASRALVEKPAPGDAPSNLAIIGRYVLTPKIFDKLEQTPARRRRRDPADRRDPDADGGAGRSSPTSSRAPATTPGTTMGWLKASVEIALQRPDLGDRVPRLPAGAPALTEPDLSGRRRTVRCRARRAGLSRRTHERGDDLAEIGHGPGRPLPPGRAARAGRHGDHLPRHGHAARSRRRAQAPPPRVPARPRLLVALPPGGPGGRLAEPPEHRHRLRLRRGPERPVHRHGAGRRRGPRDDPAPERRAAAAAGRTHRGRPSRARSPRRTPAASSTATSSRATS